MQIELLLAESVPTAIPEWIGTLPTRVPPLIPTGTTMGSWAALRTALISQVMASLKILWTRVTTARWANLLLRSWAKQEWTNSSQVKFTTLDTLSDADAQMKTRICLAHTCRFQEALAPMLFITNKLNTEQTILKKHLLEPKAITLRHLLSTATPVTKMEMEVLPMAPLVWLAKAPEMVPPVETKQSWCNTASHPII